MGRDDMDIYHRLLDENMALVQTPLIASNSYFPQHFKTALYPYNITSNHGSHVNLKYGIYTATALDTDTSLTNVVEKKSR